MSKFFINRPIVAMVISILMTIIGLVAMSGLPIAQFPNIVPPQIQINATYTGADALTVEQAVATPIEQQMSPTTARRRCTSISRWAPMPTPTSCSPRCARGRPSRNCRRTCATMA